MTKEFTNHLAGETSPYLLQHAGNPVDWYPWSRKAIEKAKQENKLLIISIGYASCHWCHVMEHECFEDTAVASIMNDHFVSIKVDREERPDVDHVYMDAIQLIEGRGGWPLNVIALPDGSPVYAVTYLPKLNWMKLLSYFAEHYRTDPAQLVEQAQNIKEGLQSMIPSTKFKEPDTLNKDILDTLYNNWRPKMDRKEGGRVGAPKFPMPVQYDFLLYYAYLQENKDAEEFALFSLDKMSNGGIYDQIGGGFSRYSVDDKWLVPHFEKMLYDNALLLQVFAKAYRKTNNPRYKEILQQTIAFLNRELKSDEGFYYSSLDADSEGEEGKYYVWTYEEINSLFGNNSTLIHDFYNISEAGNWEQRKNILHRTRSPKTFAEWDGIKLSEFNEFLESANKKLLNFRSKRVSPNVDDKVVSAWNAMMISALTEAYLSLGDSSYLLDAKNTADLLLVKCITPEFRINRNYKNGKSNINGFLDDYAFTIKAFLDLYESTFEVKYLFVARNMMDYTIRQFYDNKSGNFFYTANIDRALVVRKIEVEDNVIPSSNSMMSINLRRLGLILNQPSYLKKSDQLVANHMEEAILYGPFYSNWAISLTDYIEEPFQIAILGDSCLDWMKSIKREYIPNAVVVGSKKSSNTGILKGKYASGVTRAFVCKDKTCSTPLSSVEDVLNYISPKQKPILSLDKNEKE